MSDNKGFWEKIPLDRIVSYVDSSFQALRHSKIEDDFDFINANRTWALEVTQILDKGEIQFRQYEDALRKRGKANKNRFEGAVFDNEDDLLMYPGEGMAETRKRLLRAINHKNDIAMKRKNDEPTVERVDLAIVVPENPLFTSERSIKPLDSLLDYDRLVFDHIYVIFYQMIYVFDIRARTYSCIPYQFTNAV